MYYLVKARVGIFIQYKTRGAADCFISGEASPTFGHAMQIFLCSWTEKTINF